MNIPISKLRIGQRFTFIPAEWYGPCRLLYKRKYEDGTWVPEDSYKFIPAVYYDIKFACKCVNPPGVVYGIEAGTRVRLLSKKRNKCGI